LALVLRSDPFVHSSHTSQPNNIIQWDCGLHGGVVVSTVAPQQ